MFVSLSEQQVNEQYAALNAHQRCRILLINKSCHTAAQSIFANTPHTPTVIAAVEQIRTAMENAVATIVNEHLINDLPEGASIDVNSTKVRGGITSKEELDERLANASDVGNATGGEG